MLFQNTQVEKNIHYMKQHETSPKKNQSFCEDRTTLNKERFVDQYYDFITRLVKNKKVDSDTADDIVQQVFCTIFAEMNQAPKKFKNLISVDAWLFKIVNITMSNHFRKNKSFNSIKLGQMKSIKEDVYFTEETKIYKDRFNNEIIEEYKTGEKKYHGKGIIFLNGDCVVIRTRKKKYFVDDLDNCIDSNNEDLPEKIYKENMASLIKTIIREMKNVEIFKTNKFYFIHDMTLQEVAEKLEIPIGTVKSRINTGKTFILKKLKEKKITGGFYGQNLQ